MKRLTTPGSGWGLWLLASLAAFAIGALSPSPRTLTLPLTQGWPPPQIWR